jgi:N-hydroxyarylamine O-acetyltransferase
MIDLPAYLHRVGYQGPIRADLMRADWDTLRKIHRAHASTIPYENLDVQLKRPMTTDPHAAFEKIVNGGRGGWCYEMNGSLGVALQAAGFEVHRLAGSATAPNSHLTLNVDVAGVTYVCDVGTADGPGDPYPLVAGPFSDDGFEFRVEFAENNSWRFHSHRYGMAPGFVAAGPDEAGMEATCQWLQNSPESPFVRHATICRRVAGGYVSLVDRTLRHIKPDGVTRKTVDSADEYVSTLKSHFDLDLPEAASLWPALCERHETYLRESAARRAAKANAAS